MAQSSAVMYTHGLRNTSREYSSVHVQGAHSKSLSQLYGLSKICCLDNLAFEQGNACAPSKLRRLLNWQKDCCLLTTIIIETKCRLQPGKNVIHYGMTCNTNHVAMHVLRHSSGSAKLSLLRRPAAGRFKDMLRW